MTSSSHSSPLSEPPLDFQDPTTPPSARGRIHETSRDGQPEQRPGTRVGDVIPDKPSLIVCLPLTPKLSKATKGASSAEDEDEQQESDDDFGAPMSIKIPRANFVQLPANDNTPEYHAVVKSANEELGYTENLNVGPDGRPLRNLNSYAESPGYMAELVGMPLHQLYAFFLENDTMQDVYKEISAHQGANPSESESKRGIGMDGYLDLYQGDQGKFDQPSEKDKEGFTAQEWFTYMSAKCQNALRRAEAFQTTSRPILEEYKFQWGVAIFNHVLRMVKDVNWRANVKKKHDTKKRTFQKKGKDLDLVKRNKHLQQMAITRETQNKALRKFKHTASQDPKPRKDGQKNTEQLPPNSSESRGMGSKNLANFEPSLPVVREDEQSTFEEIPISNLNLDKPVEEWTGGEIFARLKEIQLATDEKRNRLKREADIIARANAVSTRQRMMGLGGDSSRAQGLEMILGLMQSYVKQYFGDYKHVDVSSLKDKRLAILKKFQDPGSWKFSDYLALTDGNSDMGAVATRSIDHDRQDVDDEMCAAHVAAHNRRKSARIAAKNAASVQSEASEDDGPSFLDMPAIRVQNKQAMELMDWLMSGPAFQYDDMKGSIKYCNITDTNYLRLPGQSASVTLNWWQALVPGWSEMIMQQGLTRGGIVGDSVGLGKTFEYSSILLADLYHRELEYHDAQQDKLPQHKLPPCRPAIIFTLPNLVAQTAKEVAKFAPRLSILVVHANPGITKKPVNVTIRKAITRTDPIFDQTNFANFRVVVVTSPDTWASQNGVKSMMKYLSDQQIKFEVFDSAGYFNYYEEWPSSLRGCFRIGIIDEVQHDFRNPNSLYASVAFLELPKIFLFSGSLAPKSLSDFSAYLGLLSIPALEAEAQQHLEPGFQKHTLKFDDHTDFKTGSNPFKLPQDHPARKYCFTRAYYNEFIGSKMKHDLEDQKRYQLGALAQPVLSQFILRRTYKSAYPIGTDQTIGSAMQPLHHFEEELAFCPTAQDLYEQAVAAWGPRMMATSNDPNGNNEMMPNPRAARAITWLAHCPWLGFLHFPNPAYKSRKDRTNDGTELEYNPKATPTEETEMDWLSIFWDGSQIFKDMPKDGSNLARWRYLLMQTVSSAGYKELRAPLWATQFTLNGQKRPWNPDDLLDPKKVSNFIILAMILKFSPKADCTLSHILSTVLQKDRKVLLWFQWPIIQTLYFDLLDVIPGCTGRMSQINANTPPLDRSRIQDEINDKFSEQRVFLIGTRIGGTGMNFQLDCCYSIIVDPCETLDKEDQVIGRIHRFGQPCHCWVHSLKITNTSDERVLEKSLSRSLSSTAALMSRSAQTFRPTVPDTDQSATSSSQKQAHKSDDESEDEEINSDDDDMPLIVQPRKLKVDVNPFATHPLYENPMDGWFLVGDGEEKSILNIKSTEGWKAMIARIEDGTVVWGEIRKHMLSPEVALSWIKKHSRAQIHIQHGGVGKLATLNLEPLRLQEEFARKEYLLKLNAWEKMKESAIEKKKKFEVPMPRIRKAPMPDVLDHAWTPTSEQYWDIYDSATRKDFRTKFEQTNANLGIADRWKPPAKTQAYKDKKQAERDAKREREGRTPRRATPKKPASGNRKRKEDGTPDSEPPAKRPKPTPKSDEIILDSDAE